MGGGGGRPHHTIPWSPPSLNLLKLNFDGSFIRGENRGGIGGIICDHDGAVIRNYSGPVDAFNANEAEIYSLLISCREFHRATSFKAIVKGDSKLVVLWGSSNRAFPCHLANWVEEIRSISIIVQDNYGYINGKVVWCPSFQKPMTDDECQSNVDMLYLL